VHQFVKIGAHAMTGMGTILLQDVPPYAMVSGNPCEARGINTEGLRRRGFGATRIAAAKQMHKLLYRSGLTLEEARRSIGELHEQHPDASADIDAMLQFLARADRGLVR
jgi:UDP-N-acetylglucosamine acyltransferase